MHQSALFYAKNFFDIYCSGTLSSDYTIVEIGSQNVNGSLRDVAPSNARYIGLDFVKGNGVDVVLDDPYKIPLPTDSADVVVTSSCFEHSEFFWLTFLEIARVVKPGGFVYVNVPSNGMYHQYPVDCWRFYPDSGLALASWANRSGFEINFIESFIGQRSEENIWNDFVAVFQKKIDSHNDLLPLIVDKISGYTNGRTKFGLRQFSEHSYEFNEIANLNQAVNGREHEITNLNQAVNERDLEITNLNQAVNEHDHQITNLNLAVNERDHQIANLNQAVNERDQKITNLNQVVTECNFQISNLNQYKDQTELLTHNLQSELKLLRQKVSSFSEDLLKERVLHQQQISHIRHSTSWRLTAPVRFFGENIRRLFKLHESIQTLYKNNGGALSLVFKAFRVYKIEGFKGLSRIYKSKVPPRLEKESSNVINVCCDSFSTNIGIPRINFDSTTDRFYALQNNKKIEPVVKLIAFYLPQFHPFAENDEWWGKGFTEWTNVGKAKPNYTGHYQPHCPIHLGYYDLRIPSVMEEQAKLARDYGIYGFNYYFYWFAGKILMDTPLEMMLANKSVDIKFCLTWANENWSRRWDGQEQDILIAQKHSDEDSIAFIKHVIKYFKDNRYIKVDGKPVLTVYRADIIPDIKRISKLWIEEVQLNGFPGIYLIAAQSFGIRSPEYFGFDASMEFPPHTTVSSDVTNTINLINDSYSGHIYSYEEAVANAVRTEEPNYKLFRTAMLSWDNTARKQNASHTFHGFSLIRYKQWLSNLVHRSAVNNKYSIDEKIVFINAWNEWAEGTHLEPDQKFGYGYLQATYDVISEYDNSSVNFLNSKKINASTNNRYAVILHAHYSEVLLELEGYLSNSFRELPFDLYVTATSMKIIEEVRFHFPSAFVFLVENRGRDILPFINVFRAISLNGYQAICKIHTKKSLYRDDGDQIRSELYESLFKDSAHVQRILNKFDSDDKLGMMVPSGYLLAHDDHNMTYDLRRVEQISQYLKIKFDYDYFPAGSMFWFRPNALSSILDLDDSFFELETGLADGTTAHAIERLFCLIAKSSNYETSHC